MQAALTRRAAHPDAKEFNVHLRIGPLDQNVPPVEYIDVDRL
jgi:hypothetical protein